MPPTAEQVYQLARKIYEENRTQQEVFAEYGFSSPSQASRAIADAWTSGIFKLQFNPLAKGDVPRDADLERELSQLYELEAAIVAKGDYPESYAELSDSACRTEDLRLHLELGRAAAARLQTILRSHDHIGVAGGRALFEMASVLSQQRLSYRDVKISSLMGCLSFVDRRIPGVPTPIDADDVAHRLAGALTQPIVEPLALPLALPSDTIVQVKKVPPGAILSEENWNSKEERDRYVPDIALIGVASLHPRSGYAATMKSFISSTIHDALDALFDTLPSPGNSDFYPLFDLAGNMFLADPPTGAPALPEDKAERTNRIIADEIAPQMLTVSLKQLNSVPKVILVSGGPWKLEGIYHILVRHEPAVHELCTDENTARKLIARRPNR